MIKLMIVDDSNIIRNKINRAKDSDKFDVVAMASNGLEAIDAFINNKPQVVTMDLTMPKMDGIACIDKLIGLDPNVNILVVSALSDKATGIAALERGARGFLLKPFSEEQLQNALIELSEDL